MQALVAQPVGRSAAPDDPQTPVEFLRRGLQHGKLPLIVVGESMAPLIRRGDRIWIEACAPEALRLGDVVVQWQEQSLLTHRLLAVDEAGWHTRGDHSAAFDPRAGADALLGCVIAIERNGRMLDLRSGLWRTMNRLLGWIGWVEYQLGRVGQPQGQSNWLVAAIGSRLRRFLLRLVVWS